jgi:hypothetical protein
VHIDGGNSIEASKGEKKGGKSEMTRGDFESFKMN